MYKVIEKFVDLQDENHVYNVGDVFPRIGRMVSDKRINELAGKDNKRKMPLIEKIDGRKSNLVEREVAKEIPVEAENKAEEIKVETAEEVKPATRGRKKK